jgi:hypothetical protein
MHLMFTFKFERDHQSGLFKQTDLYGFNDLCKD